MSEFPAGWQTNGRMDWSQMNSILSSTIDIINHVYIYICIIVIWLTLINSIINQPVLVWGMTEELGTSWHFRPGYAQEFPVKHARLPGFGCFLFTPQKWYVLLMVKFPNNEEANKKHQQSSELASIQPQGIKYPCSYSVDLFFWWSLLFFFASSWLNSAFSLPRTARGTGAAIAFLHITPLWWGGESSWILAAHHFPN